ncbi:MAG: oligoendopeptidase F family protein, partial [Planctomycetales bacterium]
DVATEDSWDLSSLFSDDASWEQSFTAWEESISTCDTFRGTLADGPKPLLKYLEFDREFDRAAERLGTYSGLRFAEDVAAAKGQEMQARFRNAYSRAAEATSFVRPELMAAGDDATRIMLEAPELEPFRLMLQRILRHKPHTLSQREEELLAMQSETASTAGQVFRQLNDADLSFGEIVNDKGERIELSHSTFSAILHGPGRDVRREAFHQYYAQYKGHENTLAATLAGSVHKDVFYARARNYPSALESSLFEDNVPVSVYDNLIASVRKSLPSLYRYLEVRRRAMGVDELHQYDVYVPILSDLSTDYPWDQASDLILESLQPLGSEYVATLEKGLRGRWCDRYENQGKQSGAFSCGSFDGDPFILMNYQPEVLDHVFTLAHEAGHSMHSYYSAKSQP